MGLDVLAPMCQLGLERDLRDLLRGGAADAIQYYIGRLVDGDNEETCFALAHVGGNSPEGMCAASHVFSFEACLGERGESGDCQDRADHLARRHER